MAIQRTRRGRNGSRIAIQRHRPHIHRSRRRTGRNIRTGHHLPADEPIHSPRRTGGRRRVRSRVHNAWSQTIARSADNIRQLAGAAADFRHNIHHRLCRIPGSTATRIRSQRTHAPLRPRLYVGAASGYAADESQLLAQQHPTRLRIPASRNDDNDTQCRSQRHTRAYIHLRSRHGHTRCRTGHGLGHGRHTDICTLALL